MKAALSLFLFGLVAVSAIQIKNIKPYEFTPGKMYLYDYSAHLLTGIPKLADQVSGLKMKAQIAFQAKGSSQEVVMKLTNVKISQSQDLKDAHSEPNMDSQSGEQEMARKWIEEYARELSKPISFTHVNGQVVNFVADKSEKEWSLNIKKSILGLFHLNLAPKQVMRSTEDNQMPKPVSHEDLTYYGVYESGMSGICESVYEVDQIPEFKSAQVNRGVVLNVTRTKNYNNCLTKATLGMQDNYSARHSSHFKASAAQVVKGYYPIPSEQTSQFKPNSPVKQFTTTKYNISLQHESARIEGIWCEGKIIYSTFGNNIMAYTHQKVTLNKVSQSTESTLGSVRNPEMHEELSYELPKMNEAYTRIAMDIPAVALFSDEKIAELTQNLPKLFENLARSIVEGEKNSGNNKDAMQKVVQIVSALSSLSREELENMYRRIAQSGLEKNAQEKHQVMRKMFLDALALTGSNEAAEMIAKMIIDREITSHEAREVLAALPRSMLFPTTKTLETYLELVQHPRVISEPLLYPSVAVCFGKMVNVASTKSSRIHRSMAEKSLGDESVIELAQNQNKNNKWISQLKEAAPKKEQLERYVIAASRLLEQADSFAKKVATIELLAHMGTKEVLRALEPYVTGSASIEVVPGYEVEDKRELVKERNFLRTIAIYSLAHVARRNSKQVLPLVLPVYRNTAEPHEMRLAAFTIAMLCRPEQHILESIASDLHRENDKQVTSFVVSALNSIANFTTPCQKNLARAAAEAVQSAPQQAKQLNSKYSTFLAGDFYDQKRSFGMWAATEWIKSRTSPIPRAGYLAVSQISSPFHDEILEIGFESKGLERIAKRIVGSDGLIASLIQNRKQSRVNNERINLDRKNLKGSAKLNLFVKMFEQTSIYSLDESMINEAIDQVESWAQETVSRGFTGTFVKILMPSSISKIAASQIGLPVVISHEHPLIVSLKVNKLNLNKKTGPYNGFTVSAEIEPRIMYSSYAFVYAVEPVSKVTIGTHVEKTYQAALPLKLTLTHNHEQNKWEFVAKPKSGYEAIYHKSEALTYLSKAKVVFSPTRDWLESAQTIRKVNPTPVKVEKTLSHQEIPVVAKIIAETDESDLERTLQREISKNGLIPTFVKMFKNSGLNTREVRVRIEENNESRQKELRLKWTVDENQEIEKSDEQELTEDYERSDRKSLAEEIFSQVGSAITGQKVQYPKESERKIRKEANKWYLKAMKNLRWIDQEERQLDADEEEQQRREEEENEYHGKIYSQEVEERGFMRTYFIERDTRICFTTRPALACAENNAESTKHITMDFHCLPRASPLTGQLMRDAETSVLRQLANKRVDFREELTVPVSCSA